MSEEAQTPYSLLVEDNKALRAQRDAAVEALERFSKHNSGCAVYFGWGPQDCNCGLDAALLRAKEGR